MSIAKTSVVDYDVVVIGAGISGINSSYWIQKNLPGYSYTILEARACIGGTWDLFRYPGVRSDSDLHTFGFSWRPWTEARSIADGDSIRRYMKDSAAEYGIDKKIQYRHELSSADWSSEKQCWTLSVNAEGQTKTLTTRFLLLGTGYYDYKEPMRVEIPGIADFKGITIHPQFWPENFDYTDKKIIIIGSGATTITLLPNLVEKAARVTMLQRSPSYIMSLPNRTEASKSRFIPTWISQRLTRFKFIVVPWLIFLISRTFPNFMRGLLKKATTAQLPENIPHDPHFNPRYNPWQQRMCLCPDNDFFKAFHTGKADIVTSPIKSVVADGILTTSGQKLDADIIITATGLKMQLAGGTKLSVDGVPLRTPDKFLWRTAMLQDLPNAAVVIGYDNASWTLGADTTGILVTRLLNYMTTNGYSSVTPKPKDSSKLKVEPILHLNSTYVEKAKGDMPKCGDSGPWRSRTTYFRDLYNAKYADLTDGLEFTKH